ncbi:MAG: hypothetical protein EXQ69_01950 [Acidimicrobiia bacterium]|nr:hypothetical protein [Acidimicrobiia bacterium]
MTTAFDRRSEQGVAMVTAILVMFVVSILAVGMMYTSFHNTASSARNRSWGQALHVAESGVHQAIAYLQNTKGTVPVGTISGATADGTYNYRVLPLARNRYQIDSVGTVGAAGTLQSSRRLRVTMAPPMSFEYGLFSLSDVNTKNQNVICGDVWANSNVHVQNGDAVRSAEFGGCPDGSAGDGSVTAATGYIELENNSIIEGDAWSGGKNSSGAAITLNNNAEIGGLAKGSSSSPGCGDDPGHSSYKIVNQGTIGGTATTWGTITGGGPTGGSFALTCTAAAATKQMPTFTYNASNYPAGTVHEYTFPADYNTFNSYISANKSNLSGVFYIQGGDGSTPVELGDVLIGGDLVVVAMNAPISAIKNIGVVAGNTSDKLVVLASFYATDATTCTTNSGNPADCAIGIKNNFAPSDDSVTGGDNTAVLLYAPNGAVSLKNSANFLGAIYANNIQIKNVMHITYDPRVSQIVGFGATTLDVDLWLECAPGETTTPTC